MRATANYRRYDQTFKEDALALLRRSERSFGAVARDLGVPPSTLEYWYNADMAKKRKQRPAAGKSLPVGDPSAESPEEKIARLERENNALRKENDSLKMDRAILKKAAAFFAKESE
jgi:transposase